MKRTVLIIMLMVVMMIEVSYGAIGHINGCTNTGFDTNCCTETFDIVADEGYEIVDVIVNGVSQGAISSYTFTNIIGPQTLKIITRKMSTIPSFTYTGEYWVIDDGEVGGVQNWRIKFLTSGTLTLSETTNIDVFLVGGGGAPVPNTDVDNRWGGGGGYTYTERDIFALSGREYPIVIGDGQIASSSVAAGASTAFGLTANGGGRKNGGSGGGRPGAYDGLGGDGGSDGGGSAGGGWWNYGSSTGQGTTTREFGEPTGDLYAGGGAGKGANSYGYGTGGEGGGGCCGPGKENSGYGKNGVPNTGGGAANGGNGGSGIVIIRNHR